MAQQRLNLRLVLQAIDKASNPIRRVRQAVTRLGRATGLDRVGAALGGVGRGLGRVGQEAGKFGRAFGKVMAGAGLAAGGFLGRFGTAGDRIAKVADRIGIGIVELQRLQHAFDIGGTPIDQSTRALEFFSRSIGDAARGTGEAIEIFDAMGINIRRANGDLKPMRELLDEVADAFAAQPDASKRAIAATRLFGRSGMSLINTLAQGSGPMRKLGDEAERLGVLTERDARSSEEFIDALARMRRAAAGLGYALSGGVLPGVTRNIDRFREWLVEIKPAVVREFEGAMNDLALALDWMDRAWMDLTREGGRFLDWLETTFPVIADWIAAARAWVRETSWVRLAVFALALVLGRGLLLAIVALFRPLAKLVVALVWAGLTMLWLAAKGVWKLALFLAGPLVAAIAAAGRAVKWLTLLMLRNPLVLIILGIALAALLIYKYWDPIAGWLEKKWAEIKAAVPIGEWYADFEAYDRKFTNAVVAWFGGSEDETLAWWRRLKTSIDVGGWLTEFEAFDARFSAAVRGWWAGTVAEAGTWWRDFKGEVRARGWIAALGAQRVRFGAAVRSWWGGTEAAAGSWWMRFKAETAVGQWIAELEAWDERFSAAVRGWWAGTVAEAGTWWRDFKGEVRARGWIAALGAQRVRFGAAVRSWWGGTEAAAGSWWTRFRAEVDADGWIVTLATHALPFGAAVRGWWAGTAPAAGAWWRELKGEVKARGWIAYLRSRSVPFGAAVRGWWAGTESYTGRVWMRLTEAVDVGAWIEELKEWSLWSVGAGWIEGLWSGARYWWGQFTNWFDEVIASLESWLPDWLKDALGIDPAARPPDPPPPPVRGEGPGTPLNVTYGPTGEARVGGEVRIRFENAPAGMRVESVRSDSAEVSLDVTTGIVLAP